MRRNVPEINSSSTADIAFLLLTFFLITTSMGSDYGLARRLPELPAPDQPTETAKLKERNVLRLALDETDRLTCNDEPISLEELRSRAKTFIDEREDAPDEHLILLHCHRETSYKAYIAVQNELAAAYNELRDRLARARWKKSYAALDAEQQAAVREVYPQRISESTTPTEGGEW